MGVGRAMRLSVVLLLLLALAPAIALAQGQTGTIAGTVKDATGAVLPGVTVEVSSPALIEKTRTGVTDGEGAYKIIDLRPGTYSVTFTLTGFSTVKREGIELTVGVYRERQRGHEGRRRRRDHHGVGREPDRRHAERRAEADVVARSDGRAADGPQLRQLRRDDAGRLRHRRLAERRRLDSGDRA